MKNALFTGKLVVVLISTIYSVFRIVNATQVSPFYDEFDSPQYFSFSFFPSFRTHGITLIYSILKDEFLITIFQAFVGSLVWIYLWISIIRLFSNKYLQVVFTFLYFVLASSSVVIEHDSTLLSESLAISSTIFLFATSIEFFLGEKKYSQKSVYFFGLGILWFLSTKSSNSLLFPLLGSILIITAFQKLKYRKLVLSGLIFIIFGLFFLANSLSSDITKTLTTSGTINNRLVFVDSWKNELLDSGYPERAFSVWNDFSQDNLGLPPDQAVVNLPEFKTWWKNGGESYLLKFTLSNPDYALLAPIALPIFSDDLNFRKTLLSGWSQGTDLTSEYEGFNKSLFTRTLFWPDEPEKAYLALSIALFITGLSLLSLLIMNYSKEFNLIIVSFILILIWSYLNWWFGSKPVDMARHNLSAAVMLKVISLFAVSIAFDKFLGKRRLN
jgi:hypothetical protein